MRRAPGTWPARPRTALLSLLLLLTLALLGARSSHTPTITEPVSLFSPRGGIIQSNSFNLRPIKNPDTTGTAMVSFVDGPTAHHFTPRLFAAHFEDLRTGPLLDLTSTIQHSTPLAPISTSHVFPTRTVSPALVSLSADRLTIQVTTSSRLALFSGSKPNHFLAGLEASDGRIFVLTFEDGHAMLYVSSNPDPFEMNTQQASHTSVRAAPDLTRFVVWTGSNYLRFLSLDGSASNSQYPQSILDVVVTRLPGQGPSQSTIICLMGDGSIQTGSGTPPSLPSGFIPTFLRAPNVLELAGDQAVPWIVVGNEQKLYRVDITTDTWTPLVLPTGIGPLADVAMFFLPLTPSNQAHRWALSIGNVLLLDFVQFGCSTDTTIVCLTSSGHSSWTCGSGYVYSPLRLDGYLCAGCQSAHYLISSTGSVPASCSACTTQQCSVCNQSRCLACNPNYMLSLSADENPSCLSSCPAGQKAVGVNTCLADDNGPPMNMHAHEHTLSGPPGLQFETVVPSAMLSVGGVPCLPVNGGPSDSHRASFLLLHPDRRPAIALASPSLVASLLDASSTLLNVPGIGSLAELGPFPHATLGTSLHFVYCTASNHLQAESVTCPKSPQPGDTTCQDLSISVAPFEAIPCDSVRSLGPRLVSVLGRSELFLVEISNTHQWNVVRMPLRTDRHPSFIPPPSGGLPTAWVLAATAANTFLWSLELAMAADSRLPYHHDSPPAVGQPSDDLFPFTLATGRQQQGLALLAGMPSPGVWALHMLHESVHSQGRTIDLLPLTQQFTLAQEDLFPFTQHAVTLTGLPDYPAAMVLVSTHLMAVALLRCLDATANSCVFEEPLIQSVQSPLNPALASVALLGRPSGMHTATGSGMALLLTTGAAENPLLELLLPLVPMPPQGCPPGQYLDETASPGQCKPCDPLCDTCTGPGPAGCTSCRLYLVSAVDRCLASCPAGMDDPPSFPGPCACPVACNQCLFPAEDLVECTCHSDHARAAGAPLHEPCEPCAAECAECSLPDNSQACTACPASRWLLNGTCLGTCPPHHFPSNSQCLRCDASCKECTSASTCTSCPEGYFLDGSKCHRCHATCASCVDSLSCTGCPDGLLLPSAGPDTGLCVDVCPAGETANPQQTQCLACGPACALCSGKPDICLLCREGYAWDPAITGPKGQRVGQCLPCPEGCATCVLSADLPDQCLSCLPGYLLAPGMGACQGSCPAGWFPEVDPGSTGGGHCQPCAIGCDQCTGPEDVQCTVCAPGLELLPVAPGGPATCQSDCPAGQFRHPDTDVCQACDAACSACNGPTDRDCWLCAAGAVVQDGECVQRCAPGHVALGGRCLPCHPSCAECAGTRSTECTACVPGLLALPGPAGPLPEPHRCLADCPAGHGTTPDGASCSACESRCVRCPGSLEGSALGIRTQAGVGGGSSSSSSSSSTGPCLQCERGWLLAPRPPPMGPVCVQHCDPGQSSLGSACVPCHATCVTCDGPAADRCLACQAGHVLHAGACVAVCPAGAYPEPGDGQGPDPGDQCAPCHAECAECLGPRADQCLACPEGRSLFQGACVASCPPGSHPSLGSSGELACAACHPTCATCQGPGPEQCTSCPAPGLLLLASNTCVDACPGGHFACADGRRCGACQPECRQCQAAPAGHSHPADGGSCASMCTRCQPNWVLAMDGHCMPHCPGGEFLPQGPALAEDLAAGRAACVACHPGCRTCAHQADWCTSCVASDQWLLPASGVCQPGGCPSAGMVPGVFDPADAGGPWPGPARVCLACAPECRVCGPEAGSESGPGGAGPPAETCRFLLPTGALECSAVAGCRSCHSGWLLGPDPGLPCVQSCPDGYFAEAEEGACAACASGCAACDGPGPEDCLDGPKAAPARLALALGLGLGGLVLLLLLLLVVLLLVRRYRRSADAAARRKGAAAGDPGLDADATVLNTMVELSLPGSMMVNLAGDFAPLNEGPLGSGTQATVFAARAVGAGISDRLGCPATVAVKQLRAPAAGGPAPGRTPVALFQNEISLMWLLRDCANVVRLYGYSEQPPAIIMERFQTDLATLLHSEVALRPGDVLGICQHWATGLEAMHLQGIAHCDLKPGNVFVNQQADGGWHAALGDLGTSRNLSSDRSSALTTAPPQLNALTARYASPEVLLAFRRKTLLDRELFLASDIYSAAIMLWECLARAVPWDGCGFEQILEATLSGERPDVAQATLLASAAGPLLDMLPLAWDSDPHARPVAAAFRQKCSMAFVTL
ncbi:TKL protein kinase [Fonticula alba]|uniref:TKL protein kinase n=1 Tax=Fonticula alba TaxID=691883 RepID=A0A058Z794_FONAL|nr:TKL protein kinase [Fonticula alba]KCV69803.1 TKL protein kinase [Fonticula alba]|eukprot:XP_009495409.1 TKL protein kinase [Fonticula alba]